MVQLREKRVAQTCPLCRKSLPPGPDKLFDLGYRTYEKIQAEVNPDPNVPSWEHISLSPVHQEGMDQVRELLLEAAAQGHLDAQAVCGNMYEFARGAGLGTLYLNGDGVPQSYKRGFELYQQSRTMGNTDPPLQLNLGVCYVLGYGVTKDYLEARRLYAMASVQGLARATYNLKLLDKQPITECPLLGKRVVITGTSRGDPNSRAGTATSFDLAQVRYVVELDDNDGRFEKVD